MRPCLFLLLLCTACTSQSTVDVINDMTVIFGAPDARSISDQGSPDVAVPDSQRPLTGMYVSGYLSDKVHRYDANGAPVSTFSASVPTPEALTLGPDGRLYVASYSGSAVVRVDANTGKFIDTFVPAGAGGLSSCVGLAFGPDGNLYASSWGNNSILKFNGTTGAFISTFASGNGLDQPDWFLFTQLGLFVSSRGGNQVLLFDGATGTFKKLIASGNGLLMPECLALDSQNRLLVTNRGGNSIDRYDAINGTFIDHFLTGNGLSTPLCVISARDGNLYVSNAGDATVRKYTENGIFISAWVMSGAGGLIFPTGLLES